MVTSKWRRVHIPVQPVIRPFPGKGMHFGPSVLIGADWLICKDGLMNAIVSLKMTALIKMTRLNHIVTGGGIANTSNWNTNYA